ncbi:gelsolin-like protein 2 [Nematostella vectensis]|uniref:gelsolin-like protein 2 n=1 Tax=Nematostella vectensis TaxID=45351 RepID=UPI002076FC22|nr:gelsolin-like protein 2 [Nematostella vectensis]
MSGLVKAKKYDWKDSNLALFGSDLEKNVKKESAEGEPAWEGAGKEVGVQVWRIVKFKVEHWPKEDYGKFFNGDSYIVLNTYKEPGTENLLYDVHFWIGKFSSQDEYGTAAYKTVELDHFLNDVPVQHREVEGHESQLFKGYFSTLTIMKGGADSGFKHVLPEAYTPRLFHVFKEGKCVIVRQKQMKRTNMCNSDVFIVDLGLVIYQWVGCDASPFEKNKAAQYIQVIKDERSGGDIKIHLLENQTVENFNPKLAKTIPEGKPKKDKTDAPPPEKVLNKVSDASGSLNCEEVSRGSAISRSQLDSNDVFLFDTGCHCYVWVGAGASIDERGKAMTYAHNYLGQTDHPFLPVTVVAEGKETNDFNSAF